MSVGGGVAPSVLETLEFPAALERVAAHAAGPLGAARVMRRSPASDPDAIRAALAQVAELAARLLSDDAIRAEPVPDISAALELLGVPGSALEGAALAQLGRALAAARVVAGDLSRLAADAPRTAALRVDPPPKELEQRLAVSLDADGQVQDGASRSLARARRAVRDARARLVKQLDAMLASLDPTERAPDAAVTVREGRYVIPVRATARSRIGGIVHDESATRATVFLEPPEVIELGNALRAAEVEEQREVLQVLRDLTELLRPQREAIAAAWEMCVAFDDLCARARYAVEVNGFAPAIGAGPFEIRNGRHPLLLGGGGGGGGEVVVPFDLVLAPDECTVLVSGPNTGGKTVLIKAVGLLALMAQSGIIPPIGPQSTLPVFTGVFADIGDRQSIAASLSTFSAHVAVLRDILQRAGAGSLVLLDEIGSGTDPAEGGALATAVLQTLTRRRAVTLATTHLGALKQLAAETVGIVNASLQFDADVLTPTYRLLKGVPGRSYGLAIARRLGIATDVLDIAERAVPRAERALDALLATAEARARELEQTAQELAARDERVRADAEQLEARAAELAARERDVQARAHGLERQAREQARAYLLEARRKVEEALGRARAAVDETTAREARRLVEKAIDETAGETAGEKPREEWMSLEELKRARRGSTSPNLPQPPPTSTAPSRTAATEISLIGLRVSEAEPLLVKALDDAILADLPSLRIVHGKGTGALRQLVHEALSADSRVKRFGFAPANQGGSGVTIVEFRA
jgi:DNA mismatch repair protein MutS2